MHRQVALSIALLIGTLVSVNAWAKDVNVLTSVEFTGVADYIEFAFKTKTPIEADAISARVDGSVLVLRLEDTQVKRRWLKIEDSQIKRTLLHPSRSDAPTANLRVRFFDSLDKGIVRNIRVRSEGGRLIAAVPRTLAVAQSWARDAGHGKAPSKKEAVAQGAASSKAELTPVTQKEAVADEKGTEMGPMPLAATPASSEDIPLGLPDAKETIVKEEAPAASENLPVASGLAQAPSDKLNMGAVAMSLLFLVGVAFFLWRRMRTPGAAESSGPMIRPVGTHMLGPKQGLLLVEVAGDMVLLGTGEKGVQMLTKIEGKDSPDAQPVGPRVESLVNPIDHDAVENAARPAFTERLGQAIDRIREVAGSVSVRSESYSSIHDDVASELDANDPLATLANGVEDVRLNGAQRRTARRQFAPVEPQAPEPVYGGQPSINDSDDLLNKLRNLQSA